MTMMVNMNMFTQLNLSIKHVVLHFIHPYGHGFGIDGPKSIGVHFSLSKDEDHFCIVSTVRALPCCLPLTLLAPPLIPKRSLFHLYYSYRRFDGVEMGQNSGFWLTLYGLETCIMIVGCWR
jgi:hypothetical protein